MIVLPALVLLLIPGTNPEPLDLTLDDCIRLALANNLTLQGSKLDARAAIESFNSSWGAFDTIFFLDSTAVQGTRAATPSNVVNGVDIGSSPAVTTKSFDVVAGLRGETEFGTQWSMDVGPHQVDTTSDDFDSSVFTGAFNFVVTQPLLRNGSDYTFSSVELARHDATIASLNAETTATTTIQDVTIAYWNLLFARQNLKTTELSVQLASDLVDITRRKFEQGLQNRLDVTQVEAELATRQEELLTARNQAQTAEDELRRLVFAPQDRESWSRQIRALTAPSPPHDVVIDLDAAIDVAMQYRADVASARQSLERSEVELHRAENQAEPRFDLTGGFGTNSNNTSYGTTLYDLTDINNDQLTVSVGIEVPLANRSAGYALRRSQVDRERAGVTLRDTELTVVAQVRDAVRQVQLQIERVAATAESTRLNREVYEGEVRRLENDLSTPFQVRQFQRDMFTAIDNETRAKLDLEVARAGLLAAEGRLIYAYGLERSTPELSLENAPPPP